MDDHIDKWIREAEDRWLDHVRQQTTGLFAHTFLPSHGQDHHLRVWNICKSLLREISGFNNLMDHELVEGLLLAAWFHDTGMSLSMDKEHGLLGRKMCEEFLSDRAHPKPLRYGEVLDAIEFHDLKEESVYARFTPEKPPAVLNILSIADDMDALGIIGIYRYAEIYLHRKIPLQMLGVRILGNAGERYRNVASSCANAPSVVRSCSQQYLVLEQFYNLYNQQLLMERDPGEVFRGHLGIVNTIHRLGVEGGMRPELFSQNLDQNRAGITLQTYFNELKDELEKARI